MEYIFQLTASSLLRTFFTAKSFMTESTSPSNTSASILATSFSDDKMVGSRGLSTLRPLINFCRRTRSEQIVEILHVDTMDNM